MKSINTEGHGGDPSQVYPQRATGETEMNYTFCKKVFISSVFALAVLLTIENSSAGRIYYLHSKGFGPVLIGMTPSEASSALGVRIRPFQEPDEDEIHCHYEYPDGYLEGLGFMVQDGVITRIDIHKEDYLTDTGLSVGQKEEQIFKKYEGKTSERIHPYIGKRGKYIIVANSDGYKMIFETDSGVITRFRTGKSPSVEYIEGCS